MNFSGNSTRSARREFSGESFKRIRSNICAVNFFFYVKQFLSPIYTVRVPYRYTVYTVHSTQYTVQVDYSTGSPIARQPSAVRRQQMSIDP